MKVALGQMNVIAGSMSKNVDTMLSMIEQAKKEQADLIIFPELCISGSLLSDRFLNDEFCKYIHSFNDKIKIVTTGVGDENIITMCLIFLCAGAFSGSSFTSIKDSFTSWLVKGSNRIQVNTLKRDWKMAMTVEEASICQKDAPKTWKRCMTLRRIIKATVPMVLNTTCTKPVRRESLWDLPTKQ